MSQERPDPVAIIGAGPTGIEAALACIERGLEFRLFEAGQSAGAGVADWGSVRLFTPWKMNLSQRMIDALTATGHELPPSATCPTGEEFRALALEPIAALPNVARSIEYGARVQHIAREGLTKDQQVSSPERAAQAFRLIIETSTGERIERASSVVDCSGGRAVPNWSGDGGVPAIGERQLNGIMHRNIPDVATDSTWHGSRTLLVGAGHSAQTAARDLAALAADGSGTHLTWVVRSEAPDWGSPPDDPLPERVALSRRANEIAAGVPGVDFRTGVVVEQFHQMSDGVRVTLRHGSRQDEIVADRVLALTGRVGDHAMYRQLQVHECYATSGPISLAATLMEAGGDCLTQPVTGIDVLRNPEPGFFIVGAKSYGRNSQYLLQVGYGQADQVVAEIAALQLTGLFGPNPSR